jgi:AcrR family transcriptional regulator
MHDQGVRSGRGNRQAEKGKARFLRQELLDAARKLFAEEGYNRISMRRIGAEVGCSAMAIYHYFNSKEEMLFSICEETCLQLAQIRKKETQKERTPAERLRGTMRTFMKFGLSHPNHFKLLFMTEFPSGPIAQRRDAIVQREVDNLRERVKECIEDKNLSIDMELTVQALRVSTEGMIATSIAHLITIENTDKLIEYLLQILTRELE